jgi:hypothetical protein
MMAIENKPSRNEEEYFARLDADLRKELRQRADDERAARVAAERNKCPRDGATLVSKETHHVTIDQCPQCDGIWLDKGELEILAKGQVDRTGFVGNLLNIFK